MLMQNYLEPNFGKSNETPEMADKRSLSEVKWCLGREEQWKWSRNNCWWSRRRGSACKISSRGHAWVDWKNDGRLNATWLCKPPRIHVIWSGRQAKGERRSREWACGDRAGNTASIVLSQTDRYECWPPSSLARHGSLLLPLSLLSSASYTLIIHFHQIQFHPYSSNNPTQFILFIVYRF